jgi:hypothetical protein
MYQSKKLARSIFLYRWLLASVLSVVLALSTTLIPANAAVKAGAKCTKVGIKSTVGNKVFTCIKSGRKLVWDRGYTISQNVNPDNYVGKSVDISACQIQETQNKTMAGSKGFPIRNALKTTGDVKIVIVPVDFNNAVGVGSPGDMYKDDLIRISEWSKFFSKNKLNYQPILASKNWLRAPKGAEWYVRKGEKGATNELQSPMSAIQELVTLSDSVVDFSFTDFIYFVFPESAEKKFGTSIYSGITSTIKVNTAEGIQSISAYGELGGAYLSYPRDEIWDQLIHELLHFQGFIGHGPTSPIVYGNESGSSLGIMQGQWGNSKAVTSWEAFMANWYGSKEIVCLDRTKLEGDIYITLGSIDKMDSGPISIMVKVSSEELLVIEKRSEGKFTDFQQDKKFGPFPERKDFAGKNTFTAYSVNVNAKSNRENPGGENFWNYILENGKLSLRDRISYKGLNVKFSNNKVVISAIKNP